MRQFPATKGRGRPFVLIILLLSAGLFQGLAAATNQFRLFVDSLDIPERGRVRCFGLIAGDLRLGFLPLKDWRVETESSESKVLMTARDLSAGISLQLLTNRVEKTAWKALVQGRFPEATVIREFACYSSNLAGTAFDYERDLSGQRKLAGRLAFFALPDQLLTVELTCQPASFEAMHTKFNAFLTSLRVETPGAHAR